MIAHWDDAPRERGEAGHLAGWWTDLGEAAGSVTVGAQRVEIDPGKWSTPVHVECAEEEVFYVLRGSGLSWQDGETFAVSAGDCLVHLVEEATHTLNAGPDGLDVIAFGTRRGAGGTYLPRAGVIRNGPGTAVARADKHPWTLEAEAGPPPVPAPSDRPSRIVATEDVAVVERTNDGDVLRRQRNVALAAGSRLTGLQHATVPAGKLNCPPHCHSAEEELFVVLAGDGVVLLGDGEHGVRAGSLVARPAGTGVAHAFRAGPGGLTYLAYGTREPNDIAFYPRSGKISFRGVGVIARLESLDYWHGEP